ALAGRADAGSAPKGLHQARPTPPRFADTCKKPLQAAAQDPRRTDSVEPRASLVAREVRNVGAPACQGYRVASRAAKSARLSVDCSPPRSRIARASSDSRSPQTTVTGTFSTSALRWRLPPV